MKNDRKLISLFSGGMGLDLGVEQAGFQTAVCVENDPEAVATIRLNRPELPIFGKSIEFVSGEELKAASGLIDQPIPLVIGGPPCQAFSVFGNRLGIEDSRGQLLFQFFRIVEELQPSTFIMENVRGLLSMSVIPKNKSDSKFALENPILLEKGSLVDTLFREFHEIGYRIDCFVVNAVNYGAPQLRERVILIGNRFGLLTNFSEPTHSNRESDMLPPFKTLGDAIGKESEFIDPYPEVLNFSPRKLNYLSMVPPGGNWRSLPIDIQKESMGKSWYLKGGRSAYWRKLSYAFPSPTVVTMPNHAGTSMCHPDELRAISVGEAAAIQEFPKTWKFAGNTGAKFRQIGNAVPVRLSTIAGKVVSDLLDRIDIGEKPDPNLPISRIVHLRPHVRTRSFWKNGQVLAGDHCYYNEVENEGSEKSKDQLTLAYDSTTDIP